MENGDLKMAKQQLMVDKDICELNHRTINEKIDSVIKRVEKMENVQDVILQLTYETKRLREDFTTYQREMSERVLNLESKPGKRWEAVSSYVLFAILGGIIAYIFTQIGLK